MGWPRRARRGHADGCAASSGHGETGGGGESAEVVVVKVGVVVGGVGTARTAHYG